MPCKPRHFLFAGKTKHIMKPYLKGDKMETKNVSFLVYLAVILVGSAFLSPLVAVIGGIVLTPSITKKIIEKMNK